MVARLLGYRELPKDQMLLLRKVFAYMDTADEGTISSDQLEVVLEKFGFKRSGVQLDELMHEFDGDGDGRVTRMEFYSLMAKLQGRQGTTANPKLLTKDLQLTVRRLEDLLALHDQTVHKALDDLVAEAKAAQASYRTKYAQGDAGIALQATSSVAPEECNNKVACCDVRPTSMCSPGWKGRRRSLSKGTAAHKSSPGKHRSRRLVTPPQSDLQGDFHGATSGSDSAMETDVGTPGNSRRINERFNLVC